MQNITRLRKLNTHLPVKEPLRRTHAKNVFRDIFNSETVFDYTVIIRKNIIEAPVSTPVRN